MIADYFEFAGLQYRFGQFFHIKRHAVGLVQNLIEQTGGEFFALGELVDDGAALRTGEFGKIQRRDMALP